MNDLDHQEYLRWLAAEEEEVTYRLGRDDREQYDKPFIDSLDVEEDDDVQQAR